MVRPLVSVITVCYNAERYLAGAMTSVLEQTYPEIEYVVVDGGSTDGTLEIVRSFEPRFGGRLSWTSQPDEGIYDAMNAGIARASGRIVGILNADDEYLPEAVSRAVEAFAATPTPGAVFGDAEVIDGDGVTLRIERAQIPVPGRMPARMPMCHQSLFVARDVYERLGAYDTRYRILADYDFVLRMLDAGVELAYVPVALARFRLGGVCSADVAASAAERERIRVAHGANMFVERAKRMRHAVNRFVYAVLTRRTASSGTTPKR